MKREWRRRRARGAGALHGSLRAYKSRSGGCVMVVGVFCRSGCYCRGW